MLDLMQCRRILTANHWKTDRTLLKDKQNIADWLLESGSLTEKLSQHGELHVNLIQQSWSNENWVREVWLGDKQENWIFAQTSIPKETIENVAQSVLQLHNEPIGKWLFAQNPKRINLKWLQDREMGLYARMSEFKIDHFSLWVSELFLPSFPFFQQTKINKV